MKKYSPLDHQGIPDINGPLIVADEGITPLAVSRVDFKGAGVTVTPGVANEAIVTIPGGGGAVASADTLPVGALVQWAGDTAPPGYLLCDGTAVNRYTYASLFAVIATKYGVGDGANTFNLPNMKGRVPVGRDAADTSFDVLGETGGAKAHTHGVTINDHTHGIPDHSHGGTTATGNFFLNNLPSGGNQSASRDTHYHTIPNQSLSTYGIGTPGGNQGSADSQSTLQPYLVLNFIIKAAPTTGGGADEVWIGPGAPTDLSTELWYDTDA